MKPNSIVQFERLFLASFVVRAVSDGLGVRAGLQAAKAGSLVTTYGVAGVFGALAVIYLVALALWYFAARRRSVVAKWLISGWFILGACAIALALFKGAYGFNLPSVLAVVIFLLFGWSVSYLFKPDADAWFAKTTPSA